MKPTDFLASSAILLPCVFLHRSEKTCRRPKKLCRPLLRVVLLSCPSVPFMLLCFFWKLWSRSREPCQHAYLEFLRGWKTFRVQASHVWRGELESTGVACLARSCSSRGRKCRRKRLRFVHAGGRGAYIKERGCSADRQADAMVKRMGGGGERRTTRQFRTHSCGRINFSLLVSLFKGV